MRYLLDTTLIVDHAHGYEPAMALLHRLYEEAAELFTLVAVCEALSGGSDGHRRVISWRCGSSVGKYGLGFGSVHSPMQIHEPSQPGGGGPGRISTQPVPSFSSVIIQVGTEPSHWIAFIPENGCTPRNTRPPRMARITREPRTSPFVSGVRGFTRRV